MSRLINYLNEYIPKSVFNALNQKSRPPVYILVDKNGERVKSIHDDLKTYTMAYKAGNGIVKENSRDKNDLYIVHLKKSNDKKLAVVLLDQSPPNFDYKEIT